MHGQQDRTEQHSAGQYSSRQYRTGEYRIQDRTAQDRKVQESTGHDRTVQESTGHDRTVQESTGLAGWERRDRTVVRSIRNLLLFNDERPSSELSTRNCRRKRRGIDESAVSKKPRCVGESSFVSSLCSYQSEESTVLEGFVTSLISTEILKCE